MNRELKERTRNAIGWSSGAFSIAIGSVLIVTVYLTIFGSYAEMKTPSFHALEIALLLLGMALAGVALGLLEFKQLGAVEMVFNVCALLRLLAGLAR